MSAVKSVSSIQKFALESLVSRKDGKPWFSLDPNKVLIGNGIVKYYAPEAGYQVEVQGELVWCNEDELQTAEKSEFNLEAFTKGQRALTCNGGTARFLHLERNNRVYQIKAEVEYNGKVSVQDYAKNGMLNLSVKGDLDLVGMKGEPLALVGKEITENKVDPLMNVKPISKNNLKVIMNKENEIKANKTVQPIEKSRVELELEQAIAEDAKGMELKADADRYEWLAKYLTSGVQIDFVDLQLKLAVNKSELDATIDKLKVSIVFKG